MLEEDGSAQGLPDHFYPRRKGIIFNFPEINQLELVRQAAIRQRYIDQTQSLNLSFDVNDSPKWINQVHLEGWKLGIVKTFYYLRTDSKGKCN
jgi:ribonucleoside-diphosphate reductase alpha chain